MKNKIFLFPLTIAVIFFSSIIIIFSPVGSKTIVPIPTPSPNKIFYNTKYNFEFQYNSALKIREPVDYDQTLFLIDKKGDESIGQLSVSANPKKLDVLQNEYQEYLKCQKSSDKNLSCLGYIADKNGKINSEVKIINSETLGKIYSRTNVPIVLDQDLYVWVHDDKIYSLSVYSEYRDLVIPNQILSTFKFN